MPVTIYPAPDQSGATAGWEMLARGIAAGQAVKRQKEGNYQALITQLSSPDTTEEQQSAILTQDPQQFRATYGVPIEQVGKDIVEFRKAADVVAKSGMVMNSAAPAQETRRRVLVEHPGGTAQQQQQAATLENTKVNTETDRARMTAADAQAKLASKDMELNVAKAVTSGKASLRTADGKVPTFNEMQAYFAGKLELNPLKDEQDRREKLAFILGLDPADPANRIMQHALDNDLKTADISVDQAVENLRDTRASAALKEQQFQMIKDGINPNTGKPMIGGADSIDPTKLVALGKSWDESMTRALGPLGMPSRATTATPPNTPFTKTPMVGPFGTPMPMFLWSKKVSESPDIAAALFGNGQSDPLSVRRDLAKLAPGGKVLSIDFPTIDPKTQQATTTSFKIDDLVPRVVQMRRTFTTEMPALFAAMRDASPATLIYMSAGNPLILQAARTYAPDVYKLITDAQAAAAAVPPPDAAPDPAAADPNTAPLVGDVQKMMTEIDDLKKMIQGATTTPRAPATKGP